MIHLPSIARGPLRTATLATASLVLAVAGTAAGQSPNASTLPSSPGPSPVPSASPAIPTTDPDAAVSLVDFELRPAEIEVADVAVEIDVVNDGITPHNLTVRDEAGTVIAATPNLSQGDTARLSFTAPDTGSLIIFCSLPGHESLGMRGALTIVGASEPEVSPTPAP